MRAYGEGLEAVATVQGGLGVLRTAVVPRWIGIRNRECGKCNGGETRMRDAKKISQGQTSIRLGSDDTRRLRERAHGIVVDRCNGHPSGLDTGVNELDICKSVFGLLIA